MKPPLHLIAKPSPIPGHISVNSELWQAMKEEKAKGGATPIADAFKEMVNKAHSAVLAGKL